MRFKKGTKVEVLSKKEVPSGSWRCGEIVSGNGHNYDVRYDCSIGATDSLVVERVSRKVIRPCPPPVECVKDWVPGDLVEVFENMSWKIGTVLKLMDGNYFLVRLVGSSQELRAHKSDLRVRQSWQDGEWVLVGKSAGSYEDGKSNKWSISRHYQKSSCLVSGMDRNMKLHVGDDCFPVENIGAQESHMISSRTLKRGSPYGSFHVDAYMEARQKTRAIEKEGRRQGMVPGQPSPLPEKVDAVASPQSMLGEKYMHASFYNRFGFSELDMEMAKPNGDFGCFISRSLEPNDAEDSACSVGSCSIASNSPYRLPHHSLSNSSQDSDRHFSDAESFCDSAYKKASPLPSKEDLAREIHKLELHAYHCTMEALYASGSFSWEQEALLTNLRLTLHISNDEHLMELRNLVSS